MKSIFKLVIALILVISTFPMMSASAATFTDVKQYVDEIEYLVDQKVISGYPDGTFKPQMELTRLHAVTMILREKGITDYTAPNPGFTDLKPGQKGYDVVSKAVDMGFISGKTAANGSKYFDPQATLTRAQMAKIMVVAYGLPINNSFTFTDVSADNGAKSYISTLAANNITTGYLDGTFKPNGKITRQHFAAFMARLLDDRFKPKPDLKVTFLDVGQGDSILIQAPNGKTLLVDGGTKSAGTKVVSYLKGKGVTKIDFVVATHPDADHIGGLISVLNSFKVGTFIDSGKPHTTDTYYELLSLVDSKDIPYVVAKTNQTIPLDSTMKVEVLFADENATDNNDASIVLKATYNQVSFLLTGDADTEIEKILRDTKDVKSTILKAGHHGSDTSTSAYFLAEVKPQATILSYGKDNSYGHPHYAVLQNLKAVGSKVYSTAHSGNITVTTNGSTFSVSASPMTTPTPTPTPEPTPEPSTGNLQIVSKNLDTDTVGIKNMGKTAVNMNGWKLVSVEGNQVYTFPSYNLASGATVYVTSGPNAKSGGNYLKWTGSYIWNNSGDAAKLLNPQGVVVHELK